MHAKEFLCRGDDGVTRCFWAGEQADYQQYHDQEWGRPVADDFKLFEKICLEGFQAGLSWLTILRKRENFRRAFAGFDFYKISQYGQAHIDRLLEDEGIVRHRGKIEATLNNARRAVEMVDQFDTLSGYFWQWEPSAPEPDVAKLPPTTPLPNVTATSQRLSRDLKQRGWKFIGPTTSYAFMQAMGLVNDHLPGCCVHAEIEMLRSKLVRPASRTCVKDAR